MKVFRFPLLLLIITSHFSSQGQHLEQIEVMTGVTIFSTDLPENENFRADSHYYGDGNDGVNMRSNYNATFFGVKAAMFSVNRKWSFTTGLKYSQMNARIHNDHFFFNDNRFFFYRFREEGTTTDYLVIRELHELTQYIGLPVEVRLYPFLPRKFNLFFKAGGEINFTVASQGSVEFDNSNMLKYESEVLNDFRSPDTISGIVYVAAGFHIGKPGKTQVGMEVPAPAIYVNPHAGGLVRPIAGAGFVAFVIFPLNRIHNE